MADIDALVDEWGEDNVQAAFWLQEHIKEQGLDGIKYMEAARNHLRVKGEGKVEKQMKQQMDDNY